MIWARPSQAPEQLNICLVGKDFPIQGRATDKSFLWPLARGLVRKGHRVTILSSRSFLGKAETHRDGVRVFYLFDGYPNWSHLSFPLAVLEKFKILHEKEPFDIVHSFDRSGLLVARNKLPLGVPVAFDVEATQMAELFSILGMSQETVSSVIGTGLQIALTYLRIYFGGDRELLRSADGIFVTSPQQRIFLERYFLYPDRRVYTVPYGLELTNQSEASVPTGLRAKWKIPEQAQIVLTISDMTSVEDLAPLLQAFEKVAIKKPNAYLVVIGTGPAFKRIERLTLDLALATRVIFTEHQKEEEISEWISTSDIYVNLSSRTTGFEPSMIEAMAQRKVLIGSELSPMANVIEDGQDGFLLRPADSESLAHLLIELFSGSISSLEIGQKAREKVSHIFDPTKMVEALHESYYDIWQLSPSRGAKRRAASGSAFTGQSPRPVPHNENRT